MINMVIMSNAPNQIKQHLLLATWVSGFRNLKFDSQTKERCTNTVAEVTSFFGDIDFDAIAKKVINTPEIIDPIVEAQIRKKEALEAAELRKKKVDPAVEMAPFAPAIDKFEELTGGRNWYEMLLGVYLTAGFLDDFFVRLVPGLPKALAGRVEILLETDRSAEVIVVLLKEGMDADPTLSSRLAVWGRRLVGDTQLVARSALHMSDNRDDDEQRIEPVFTDLIAAHSRRMDELGLTA